jgi:protein subunit release factor B
MSLPRLVQLPRVLGARAHIPTSFPQAVSIHRSFSSTAILPSKPLPPRRPILDSEITESFLKGSGPGGQKINKTSSAVQLKHLPTGIVVKCQETRSRTQNRKYARRLLQEKLEELELGDMARTKVKGREIAGKKKSAAKKKRRKYRALEEGKDEDEDEDVEEDGEGEAGSEVGLVEGARVEDDAPDVDTRVEGGGKAK